MTKSHGFLIFSNGYDSCYKNHVGFNKNGLKRSLVSDWVVLGSIGDGFAGFMVCRGCCDLELELAETLWSRGYFLALVWPYRDPLRDSL